MHSATLADDVGQRCHGAHDRGRGPTRQSRRHAACDANARRSAMRRRAMTCVQAIVAVVMVQVVVVALALAAPERAAAQDGDGELGGTARERIVGSALASVLVTVPTTIAFGIMDLHYAGDDRRIPVGWATFQGVVAAIDVM